MLERIGRMLGQLWNSICYMAFRRPLVVSAYVDVRGGKVVRRNWGDDINVYLLEKLSGRKVVVKNQSLFHKIMNAPSFLCIGSTLGFMIDGKTTVWGAGAMYPYKSLPCKPRSVASVRGPLTRKALMDSGVDCPEVYGDPALLVSMYYNPDVYKKHRLGIVVHYTDEDNQTLISWLAKHPDVIIIKMGGYERWEDIPDQICSCEEIWSSSLHGLIVSDAYSVPNRWVRFNGNVVGGEFKFKDYMMSVNRRQMSAYNLQTEEHMERLLTTGIQDTCAEIDYDRIIASCPFNIEG